VRARGLVLVAALLGACSAPEEAPPRTTSHAPEVAVDRIAITRPDWAALDVDDVAPPTRDAVPLSEDPVRRAALAVTDLQGDRSIYVLGRDGRWRRVDRPHLRYEFEAPGQVWPVLSPASIDASATRLAVPQDDSLVVIDLTTGGFRRYHVPGLNDDVAWEAPDQVYVGHDARLPGALVDLQTGQLTDSMHRRTTRVLPDGSALTWGGGRGNDAYYFNVMRWDDGHRVHSPANNSLGARPLVLGDVAIGMHNPTHSQLNPDLVTGDAELDELMRQVDGVVAVDNINGDVLGFLALSDEGYESTSLLGWLGEAPVLGLVDRSDPRRRSYVVSWDYETGELSPLATLPTWYVAWGVGLDGPVGPVVARPPWRRWAPPRPSVTRPTPYRSRQTPSSAPRWCWTSRRTPTRRTSSARTGAGAVSTCRCGRCSATATSARWSVRPA
jgi:hypothetical protein